MKRVAYIAITIFALSVVSCSKQDIQPTSEEPAVPVWKSSGGNDNEPTVDPVGSGSDNEITDPNQDPEFSNGTN